jgi:ABC-type Na+ efflux pump permease subunit
LRLTGNQTNKLLFAAQGIGAILCAIFLAAYFGGLPTTQTLNSEPAFIVSQSVVGAVLLIFVFILIFAAVFSRKK